ncbi:hypothetical protein HYC85_009000 [Camellia sinensis]|uniref:DNA polymerase III gamma subunit domain-containing protein n=1 Tax=Camellia sinensis TaxID=4442 RepID=A0A7J7HVP7_CAMSI|nr:hypothetical protein HYC85_009000 [Camellia sinensis]
MAEPTQVVIQPDPLCTYIIPQLSITTRTDMQGIILNHLIPAALLFRPCSSAPYVFLPQIPPTAMGHPLKQAEVEVEDSFSVKSSLVPSSSARQKGLLTPLLPEPPQYRRSTSTRSLKSRHIYMGCSTVPLQWSRMHEGIRRRRRKVFCITSSRRSNNNGRNKQKTVTETESSCRLHQEQQQEEGQDLSSKEEEEDEEALTSREEIYPILLSQDKVCRGLRFDSALQTKTDVLLLSHKYQPKLFQDITGHEFTVKAISKAIEKTKIARLYLFHGPNGTGKTSTARIFAMALNCESTSLIKPKPCWSCRGCSRSLYIMELCSGSRIAGFERIKTLLQSTSFTQAIPGFKVLIIKECHSFNAEAWDELLGMVERGHGSRVVFVLITVDANMVPTNISSRCQKFCFPKLKKEEMTLKLAKIVACEGIRIDKEALKLIIAKAEGSLREAENLLDQLALLGSTITSSMVQQLVGLVPQNMLLDLLATATSGDTIKTIRYTRELIATGVEPRALVSQLAYLISDILSGAVVSDSSSSMRSSKDKDKRLSRSRSKLSGKPNAVSKDIHSRGLSGCSRSNIHHHPTSRTSKQPDMDIIEPGSPTIKSIDKIQRSRGKEVQKEPNLAHMSDMEEIWQNMLGRIESIYIKDFLCHQVKLASLTVSRANMIVHLMFKRHEDKMAAQMSEESISKALKNAIGCPVTVNMSLEPVDLEIIKANTISISSSQLVNPSNSKQQQRIPFLGEFFHNMNFEAAATRHTSTTTLELSPPSEQHSRSRTMKFINCTMNQRQHREEGEGEEEEEEGEGEANTTWPQNISPFLGLVTQKNQFDTSADPERDVVLKRGQNSIDTAPHIMKANKPKHRWLSLSSIPQSDASVEPYSQDILFEKTNEKRESNTRKTRKFQKKGFLTTTEDRDSQGSATHQ